MATRGRYEEDVHAHNHNQIWGSYFDRTTFRWGYADDLATVRNAYGTGAAGKYARQLASAKSTAAAHHVAMQQQAAASGGGGEGGAANSSRSSIPQSAMYGTGEQLEDAPLDQDKVKAHMRKLKDQKKSDVGDERKRGYNAGSKAGVETTAEEMEAYHRAKHRSDDPMANMAEALTDDEA